jgi:transketolase
MTTIEFYRRKTMRKLFGQLLKEEMKWNDEVFLLAGDVGYGVLDMSLPNSRNMGASEQLLLGAAVGLTYEGKTPVCYAITPHLLLRPAEWIRNYLGYEGVPVKLVGAGRDQDYGNLGHTHWCEEDGALLDVLAPNVERYRPESKDELEFLFKAFLYSKNPAYLNLRR